MSFDAAPGALPRLILACLTVLLVTVGGTWLFVAWPGHATPDPRTSQELSGSHEQLLARSMERANAIVVALDRFRADRGRFPAGLNELVPQHLAELRLPCTGNPGWAYHTDPAGEKFTLAFGDEGQFDEDAQSPYPCMYYESSTGTWAGDH